MQKLTENKGIRWLFDELPDLVQQQIISDQAATALQEHYRPRLLTESKSDAATRLMHTYAGPLLTAFAALLVGGGMILILAHNWEMLSREMRTVIAILPALCGLILAAWVMIHDKSRAWREFIGIWLMMTAYSSLGIISQTYHLNGKFVSFMMVICMSTLFVPLILRSVGANIIQLVSFVVWAFAISDLWSDNFEIWYTFTLLAGLLLGPLPYYLLTRSQKNIWERLFDSIAIVITTYFLAPPLLYQLIDRDHSIVPLLMLVVASILLLIGREIKNRDAAGISATWQLGGWLGIGFLSFLLSVHSFNHSNHENIVSWWTLPILALVPYGIWQMHKKRWFEGIVGLLPTAVYIATLMGYHNLMTIQTGDFLRYDPFALFIAGIFILFSLSGAILGFVKKDFGILNGSMAILLLAIIIRFFDGDYSALARGIVFISAGITILVVNLLANRLSRKKLEPSK